MRKWKWSLLAVMMFLASSIAIGQTCASGTCTLTYTQSGGQGLKNCPAQVSPFDTYTLSDFSSLCQFSCAPTSYDSTFTPQNCGAVTASVAGQPPTSLTSTAYGTFAASDCNFHNVQITTTVIDAQGVRTPYTGGQIGFQCTFTPSGVKCS